MKQDLKVMEETLNPLKLNRDLALEVNGKMSVKHNLVVSI